MEGISVSKKGHCTGKGKVLEGYNVVQRSVKCYRKSSVAEGT